MVLLYFVFLGVCQATEPTKNVFGQSVTNWNDVTGEAMGEFQFLGELHLQEYNNQSAVAEIELLTKKEAPDTLKVLVLDNEPTSFDMIGRGVLGDSCNAKELVSKGFTACKPGRKCFHGLQVIAMAKSTFGPEADFCPSCKAYSQKIALDYFKYRNWYFVAANCGGGPVQIEKFNIASQQASPLPPLHPHNRRLQAPPAPPAPAPSPVAHAISGYALGNFELLGSLCFFPGPLIFGGSSMTMTVSYNNQSPGGNAVYLLAYDDAALDTLFDSKFSSYSFNEKECLRRQNQATKALQLSAGVNSGTLTVSSTEISYGLDKAATRLTFVAMQCTPSSSLKVGSIKIHSSEAKDCANPCPLLADCGNPVVVHGRRLRESEG